MNNKIKRVEEFETSDGKRFKKQSEANAHQDAIDDVENNFEIFWNQEQKFLAEQVFEVEPETLSNEKTRYKSGLKELILRFEFSKNIRRAQPANDLEG